MASEHQVRQYLAYWFQLGKKLLIHNGRTVVLPQPVIEGDRYSRQFEDCWQQVKAVDAGDCYLEGTTYTISELLTPAWDISSCARCSMPVPMVNAAVASLECPCIDIPTWPNLDAPLPRSPISTQAKLVEIRDRLRKITTHIHPETEPKSDHSQAS
ncbi:hypothetical protein BST81_04705 [Leptolyngbya sp. 'hensonii']|uniref:hypothetical protein n=1 Tax=Leptolyngbya sp. 'hensonii' TaxID=1922337 RepID=UPI00094F8E45|nr:hypothetical protein [Leptolyngbya sp. 'hensonii']OLP19568.1 hypothetical protein BST81_04705 [Leptolyngbya sp. 'hensonii']